MTKHTTGTREQWLAARLELLEAEKELKHRTDEVARQRQDLPWVRIEKDYRFETNEGSAALADLFRGRSQVLVYHFMFGADYTAGCLSCSSIADGFNGFEVHLANHDVMLWAISQAPLAKLQAYKRRMGWTFPGGPRKTASSTSISARLTPRCSRARASSTTSNAKRRCSNAPGRDPCPNSRRHAEPRPQRIYARGRE
jgi:predicted dithiol-disulfide oxidoreductase (DUF899 family)